ncbi:endonuclease I [Kipferlia bialata]|uniref:Endonuclease I n=1 Tax=Kipferlia bialata TaxID=797122 RepID=A0A9K3D6G2_9EUKA|nr:endonuclease I [Kipferlia bialata]|eukprot:g10364.t1
MGCNDQYQHIDYQMHFPRGETNTYYNGQVNCEHTVPQSLFDKEEPMRSDVHHLRPAWKDANSARSNYPFTEIPDEDVYKWYYLDYIRTKQPAKDLDNWSRVLKGVKPDYQYEWEPHVVSRGTIARCVMYFFTMYEDYMYQLEKVGDINLFLKWNDAYPPSDWDMTRNDNAEEWQGNRNPFVDHPELCERAYQDML